MYMNSNLHSRHPIILVIDDEPAILKEIKSSLQDEGYYVDTLDTPAKAIDLVGQLVPDLVLLDIFMPGFNGLELLTKIKQEFPLQKVMIISGFGTISIALDAIKLGAIDFIEKPLNLDELLQKLIFLKKDLSSTVTTESLPAQHYKTFGIIGQSYLFCELMQSVDQLAPLSLPILLYGEHGVGKTLIAHYLHHKKFQNISNFVIYDCHHEELFKELATILTSDFAGTIYLKHLHRLSLQGQQELLKILKNFSSSHVRYIASSCESLFGRVRNNTFNASLFHFFNVTPLEIPSINKRRHDIPLLVSHFLVEQNAALQRHSVMSVAGLRMLRNHVWVGNVGQLQDFIATMVAALPSGDHVITAEFMQQYLPDPVQMGVEEQAFTRFSSLQDALNTFEKQFLLYTLKKNKYDLEQVSDRLSLNISQLRDKMLELQITYKG